MVQYSFDLALWTLLFFIVGMIKPNWALFFLKKPSRFLIMVITMVLVMMTFTLYGEGHRREQLEKEAQAAEAKKITTPPTPVPVPVPTAPEKTIPEKKFL